MIQVPPEGKFTSERIPYPKNATGPTTSEVIILGEDAHRPISQEMRQSLEYAAHEADNFSAIDQQVNGFIGILGKDLSEIQAATTDPAILIRQAEHLAKAADHLIDGSEDSKFAILQRNQENLGLDISQKEIPTNDKLEVQEDVRHKRIVDVLLANRTAREGILQTANETVLASIESYRSYLLETHSAELTAFNAHFLTARPSPFSSPEKPESGAEFVTPTTAELETHFEQVTDETVSPARGIALLGSKAIEKLVIQPFKKGWDFFAVSSDSNHSHTEESQLTRQK